MEFQAEHYVELPPQLRRQFDLLEKRLWRVDTAIAVAGSIAALLFSYTVLFISDRLWETPVWLRLLITGIGILLVGYFAYNWLRLWVIKPRDARALAKLVQKHYRLLGDRLLGIVELADPRKRPTNVSTGLVKAAIAQVASEAVKYDFRVAVATRKPKIYCLIALGLFVIVAAPFLIVPEAGANALVRWIIPFSSVQRFTFVNIEGVPSKLVVPHGEPFEIVCDIQTHPLWKPRTASFRFNNQPEQKAKITGKTVKFNVPGQTEKGVLRLSIGDVTKEIEVEPLYRPQLKQLSCSILLPEYLELPPVEVDSRNGRVSVVEGSKLQLKGEITRKIVKIESDSPFNAFKVNGAFFETDLIEIKNDSRIVFNWTDEYGLSAKTPFTLYVFAKKDAPPVVELQNLPPRMAMLEDEVALITVSARDDFGVNSSGGRIEVLLPGGNSDVPQVFTFTFPDTKYMEEVKGTFAFSPSAYELPPGAVVNLRGTAVDKYPGRRPSESTVHKIYILSREEHAKFILEQFEKIRGAIEELVRQQENLVGDTKQTTQTPPDKMMSSEVTKQIAEQGAQEQDYKRQLERLAEETRRILKEAMRNKAIPENLLKDWANNAAEMEQIAASPMQQATKSLSDAQESQNQSSRSNQLDKALKEETNALEALQELQQKMAKDLDKMQAKGLAMRLRKIAEIERNIGNTIRTNMPKIIGLRTNQLDNKMLRLILGLSDEQDGAGKETSKLQSEIERFYQRTGDENHGFVADDMKKTQVVEELSKNSDRIKENIAAQALQYSYKWGDKFEEWAKKLDSAQEGGDGSGSGEGEQMNELDLEQLLALVRIRDEQETLIERTQFVEKKKAELPTYKREAARIAFRQTDLREGLEGLSNARIVARVRPRIMQAIETMTEAELMLRKPDTSKVVTDTQTDALNILDDAIRAILSAGQVKRPGANTVAQMMNMGQGQRAGGNPGGQASAGSGKASGNDPKETSLDSRGVEKTSGGKTRVLPAEFRDALQNYFNAIEQANP